MAMMLVLATTSIFAQETSNSLTVPLGDLTITAPEEIEARYAPVEFPHSLHFNFSCKTCHHKWDGNSQIQGCQASGCHAIKPQDADTAKDAENGPRFSLAYHKSCRGCHRAMINERKTPTGPVKCDECHVKQ